MKRKAEPHRAPQSVPHLASQETNSLQLLTLRSQKEAEEHTDTGFTTSLTQTMSLVLPKHTVLLTRSDPGHSLLPYSSGWH